MDELATSHSGQRLRDVHRLNANAVRITIFPDTFGYPQPTAVMQSRLAELVKIATHGGLKVQLSIFDEFDDWADITGSEQWAQCLLAPYADDPRIAFIDIRNELDPNDPREVAWARELLPFVQSVVGSIPVTVSKSGAGAPAGLLKLKTELAPVTPDFWDWHYYGVEGLAYGFFKQASAIAAPQPLYIGETGQSTWPSRGLVNGLPASAEAFEQYQAYYYRVIATAARNLGLPPVAPWMLWDLNPAGAPPQPTPAEYHYGLYRLDGTAKPAAAVVAAYFAGKSLSLNANYSLEDRVPDGKGGELPALWRINEFDGHIRWVPAVVHQSSGSVRMSQTHGSGSSAPQIWVVPVDSQVVPGQTVTASVWAKGVDATGGNRLAIAFFDATGVYCGQIESRWLPAGTTGAVKLVATEQHPLRRIMSASI